MLRNKVLPLLFGGFLAVVAWWLLKTPTPPKKAPAPAVQALGAEGASVEPPERPEYCNSTSAKVPPIHWLDVDLDALQNATPACGSFTDWFAVNLKDAFVAGVPRAELVKRIDRLIAFANKGKFLSSYEELLFRSGGEVEVRRYAEAMLVK